MKNLIMIIPILIPLIAGILMFVLHLQDEQKEKTRRIIIFTTVIINSILICYLLFNTPQNALVLCSLPGNFALTLKIDLASKVFLGLVAFMWPLASLYAFEYMEEEKNKNKFFGFYTMTYGITCGLAMSANLITMYLFYECLTFLTIPLIMHDKTNKAISASFKYMIYSIFGASFAFIGMSMLIAKGTNSLAFVLGGNTNIMQMDVYYSIAFLLLFFGFGVKAAIFPLYDWLPTAGVAPTPVTALLHAVVVVKAGVFAIMRVIYYSFGIGLLQGSAVQFISMIFAIFTILFGSCMAVKEQHIKRRLAYSTISNLSYIIFAFTLMNYEGLQAGLCHMVFHGLIKITLFFCAGAIIHKTHREYVSDFKGFAQKMPITFIVFSIASMALIGIPLFCGFVSKYEIAVAAINANNKIAFCGIVVLVISAFLTAVYLCEVIIKAYFPPKGFDYEKISYIKEVGYCILIPYTILVIVIVLFGVYSQPFIKFLNSIAI